MAKTNPHDQRFSRRTPNRVVRAMVRLEGGLQGVKNASCVKFTTEPCLIHQLFFRGVELPILLFERLQLRAYCSGEFC